MITMPFLSCSSNAGKLSWALSAAVVQQQNSMAVINVGKNPTLIGCKVNPHSLINEFIISK